MREAQRVYTQAFRTAVNTHLFPNALDALAGLAWAKAAGGEMEQAFDLAFQILNHPAATRAARQHAEKLMDELEAETSFKQLGRSREQLQVKSLEEILEEINFLSSYS